MGVIGQAVEQATDEPNDVTVTHDFRNLEQAKALADLPALKDAMEKSGVSGPPTIWFTTRAGEKAMKSPKAKKAEKAPEARK